VNGGVRRRDVSFIYTYAGENSRWCRFGALKRFTHRYRIVCLDRLVLSIDVKRSLVGYPVPADSRSEGHIMKATAAPIHFAGSMLTEYRHACAFFCSPQEEYATILPFVLDGLQRLKRYSDRLRSEDKAAPGQSWREQRRGGGAVDGN
jgi:hypothetical protein